MIHIRVGIRCHIAGPRGCLCDIADPSSDLHRTASDTLHKIVNGCAVSHVLARNHAIVHDSARHRLRRAVHPCSVNVALLSIGFRTTHPPRRMGTTFSSTVTTHRGRRRCVHRTRTCAGRIRPHTGNRTRHVLRRTHTCGTRAVLRTRNRITHFTGLLPRCGTTPRVAHRHLCVRAVRGILNGAHGILIGSGNNGLVILPLSRVLGNNGTPTTGDSGNADGLLHLPPTSSSAADKTDGASSADRNSVVSRHHTGTRHGSCRHRKRWQYMDRLSQLSSSY